MSSSSKSITFFSCFILSSPLFATLEVQGYGVREQGKFKNFLHTLGLDGSYELYGAKFINRV
ncbi:MAG: hypothetical protein CJD30_08610 [Sulfuricurvum sp. PD_MW2]|jgi:hypothetical protein|uniref:hypothetical protein n=1 Tax=Sulfuricurvum sp. PD_MW2 TaxID=2027917 RepID=UPI000C065095|nr:hypothetical protein [Sulfuricurvum sp. PD_MW2]PHM17056.1 MAG: hypothetical protein CJD30_08610 [Sulfuricurvum sp. PD_MW2]